MPDALELLLKRNSAPKLTAPGPEAEALAMILAAGLRAPDHAWLTPWRFLTVKGERRNALGEVLAQALAERDPTATPAALDKARQAPLRAPLVIVVMAVIQEHPKVPPVEQRLAAGCAAQAMMLAAEAQGYAAIWRTGDAAFDRRVVDALGGAENEEIVGFIYVGTRAGPSKPLPAREIDDYVSDW